MLTRFARFCKRTGVGELADVDRTLIESYFADLHAHLAGAQRHNDHIGGLNAFLHAVRQHHWDDGLPATALIFPTTTRSGPTGPCGSPTRCAWSTDSVVTDAAGAPTCATSTTR